MDHSEGKKCVCVALAGKEHRRLSEMARETGRTPAGYLRWLLHDHFKKLDNTEAAGE